MPVNHVVKPGESLVAISEAYGFFADTLWSLPENAELREKRKDMNVLLAGDVVFVPDKRPRDEKAATGRKHTFRRRGIPALFRLQLFDGDQPRANQAYELVVDEVPHRGVTDGDGVLVESVPAGARKGRLVVGPDKVTIDVRFGELDPIDTDSGVRHRLSNLGFECRDQDDAALRDAVTAFQHRFGLEPTGVADAATLEKLEGIHDVTGALPKAPSGG